MSTWCEGEEASEQVRVAGAKRRRIPSPMTKRSLLPFMPRKTDLLVSSHKASRAAREGCRQVADAPKPRQTGFTSDPGAGLRGTIQITQKPEWRIKVPLVGTQKEGCRETTFT